MITREQLTKKLQEKAATDPVAKDTFLELAHRQRARGTLTTRSLYLRMVKNGFKHERSQYEHLLSFLGSLGLGQVDRDYKGRVRGLKGINISLPSIGAAALGAKPTLEGFRKRQRFTSMPLKAPEVPVQEPKQTTSVPVTLTMQVQGKEATISLAPGFSNEDIARIISCVQGR